MSTVKFANDSQRDMMQMFYSIKPTKVLFNKKERKVLWNKATKRNTDIDLDYLDSVCPSFKHRIQRSYDSGDNIQPAIFSECVYAQTLANMFGLNKFVNYIDNPIPLSEEVHGLLKRNNLFPRYMYLSQDGERMLVQAGSCGGVDSALINVKELSIHTIEFKEPWAKTSEPDLPEYKEDGSIVINEEFLNNNPQFKDMVNEHLDLNFFEAMGRNIKDFTEESIKFAVENNYKDKYAEVICTEDKNGYLVIVPTNHVSIWADIRGEIRPAGRNAYWAWNRVALENQIISHNGIIKDGIVSIKKSDLKPRTQRGGNGRISGYKITPLFVIFREYYEEQGDMLIFDFNKVKQLRPTIAGKMLFSKLKYDNVKKYYFG